MDFKNLILKNQKIIGIWDVESQKLIKKMKGHTSYVNSCHPARRGPDLVVSGSDDGKNIRIEYVYRFCSYMGCEIKRTCIILWR